MFDRRRFGRPIEFSKHFKHLVSSLLPSRLKTLGLADPGGDELAPVLRELVRDPRIEGLPAAIAE
jgi:hypothetical protein